MPPKPKPKPKPTTKGKAAKAKAQPLLLELTAETRKKLIDALLVGSSRALAAATIGATAADLQRWVAGDPDLDRDVKSAEAQAQLRAVAQMQTAAAKGDWRAAVAVQRTRETSKPAEPDDPNAAEMTVAEYARKRGCTVARIYQAVRAGRVARLPNGKIDVAVADAYWATLAKVGAGRGVGEGSAVPQELAAARLRREVAQAQLAEMKAAELQGRLIPIEEASALWFDACRIVRERLLGLPAQLVPLLTGQTGHKMRQTIDGAIRAALADLPVEPPVPKVEQPGEVAEAA